MNQMLPKQEVLKIGSKSSWFKALFLVHGLEMFEQKNKYPLVICNSLLLKMAIEIVSFPIKNGDFP